MGRQNSTHRGALAILAVLPVTNRDLIGSAGCDNADGPMNKISERVVQRESKDNAAAVN
jgi:hypothetical protein